MKLLEFHEKIHLCLHRRAVLAFFAIIRVHTFARCADLLRHACHIDINYTSRPIWRGEVSLGNGGSKKSSIALVMLKQPMVAATASSMSLAMWWNIWQEFAFCYCLYNYHLLPLVS